MKVDINVKTSEIGFFKKKTNYQVILSVELNEEEKAIIKKNKVEDKVIMSPQNEMATDLTFKHLVDGKYYSSAESPSEVESYKEYLKERLKLAKTFLDQNKEAPKDESFEL